MSRTGQFKAKKTTEESQKDEKLLGVSDSLLSTVCLYHFRERKLLDWI